MPKDKNIKKKPPGKNRKPNKKFSDRGNNGKNGKRPKKKAETVKVYLPALIPGRGPNEEEPPLSEYEISYKDSMLATNMEKLAAQGLNNKEIIEKLGISADTFYRRLREDSYFSYSLYKHRGKAVNDVEHSLLKACNGFDYFEQVATPSGKVMTVLKHKTPDVGGIKFFLTNRAHLEWKNKVENTIQAGESMGGVVFSIKRRGE